MASLGTGWLMLDGGHSNDGAWLYKAEEENRLALQDDPESSSAHAHFAAVFLYQSQKDLAWRETKRALEIDPRNSQALHIQMHCHHMNGDYSSAEAMAKDLMEREPLFWPARMMFGDLRRQQGFPNESIVEQQKILEHDAQNIYALHYLARAHLDAGELENARQILTRARQANRRNYWCRLYWAILMALEGKLDEAKTEMDEAVLKWASIVIWYTAHVADFYAILGEVDTAFEWIDRAVRNGDE